MGLKIDIIIIRLTGEDFISCNETLSYQFGLHHVTCVMCTTCLSVCVCACACVCVCVCLCMCVLCMCVRLCVYMFLCVCFTRFFK